MNQALNRLRLDEQIIGMTVGDFGEASGHIGLASDRQCGNRCQHSRFAPGSCGLRHRASSNGPNSATSPTAASLVAWACRALSCAIVGRRLKPFASRRDGVGEMLVSKVETGQRLPGRRRLRRDLDGCPVTASMLHPRSSSSRLKQSQINLKTRPVSGKARRALARNWSAAARSCWLARKFAPSTQKAGCMMG